MSLTAGSAPRRRLVAALAAAAVTLSLVSCSSNSGSGGSSSSSTSSSESSTDSSTAGSSADSAMSGGSDTAMSGGSMSGGSGSAESGGGATSVAQITGSGNGKVDQATFDAAINGAPKADDATVQANSWAKAIKARGTLNTGGTETSPIFSLKNPGTGKLTGFDAGLAQMLAQYIIGAPTINLTVVTVDTRETLVQNGTVDTVFATYSITPARAKKIAFAGPYLISGDAIAVKKDNTSITKLDDLAGKTVTTESNSTAVNLLKEKVPTAKLLLFAEDAQCQAALTQGRADAYVLDQSILISDAIKNNAIKVVGAPFTVDPYGIGLSMSNPDAKKFVDAWLEKIFADGSWAKLWKATVGTVVAGDAPAPPKIGSVPGS